MTRKVQDPPFCINPGIGTPSSITQWRIQGGPKRPRPPYWRRKRRKKRGRKEEKKKGEEKKNRRREKKGEEKRKQREKRRKENEESPPPPPPPPICVAKISGKGLLFTQQSPARKQQKSGPYTDFTHRR